MNKNLNPKFIKEFEYVGINEFVTDFIDDYIACYMTADDFRIPHKDEEGFTVYTSFDDMSSEKILKTVNNHVDRMIAQVKDLYAIDVIKKVLEYSKEHRLLPNEFWLCRNVVGRFFGLTLFKFNDK